jgi:hypothetical protein
MGSENIGVSGLTGNAIGMSWRAECTFSTRPAGEPVLDEG